MSLYYSRRAVVIAWELDLQLHVQSVPITTNVSSNPAHGGLLYLHPFPTIILDIDLFGFHIKN